MRPTVRSSMKQRMKRLSYIPIVAGGMGFILACFACWVSIILPLRRELADLQMQDCEKDLNALHWLDEEVGTLRVRLEESLLGHASEIQTNLEGHPGAKHFGYQIHRYFTERAQALPGGASEIVAHLPPSPPSPPPLRLYYRAP